MTLKFYCTCGQKVSATVDMVGVAAACPRCGAKVIVPSPEELDAQEPKPAPPPDLTSSTPPPGPSPTTPVSPLSVVPRPMRLLWLSSAGALAILLITGAVLFRNQWEWWLKIVLPAVGVVVIGGAVAALFLRLAIRIVASFDLAYLEAWLVSIVAAVCSVLAMVPMHSVQPGSHGAETAIKLLPLTNAVSLILVILAYSFLIRNAHGKPVGVVRSALAYFLQVVFLAFLLGLLGGIGAFFWYSSKIRMG